MTEKTFQVHVVSAEEEIFSGDAVAMTATGIEGEMGIIPNHSPLLTFLKPGSVMIRLPNQHEEIIYVQGGVLEVQPHCVTILSDTAKRAGDLDEVRVLAAREHAEHMLKDSKAEVEYAVILEELARAAAQLRILEKLKKRSGI